MRRSSKIKGNGIVVHMQRKLFMPFPLNILLFSLKFRIFGCGFSSFPSGRNTGHTRGGARVFAGGGGGAKRGQNCKMSRWALRQPWKRRSAGQGGGGLRHIFFRPKLWQNYYYNGVGVYYYRTWLSWQAKDLFKKNKAKTVGAIVPPPPHATPLTPHLGHTIQCWHH